MIYLDVPLCRVPELRQLRDRPAAAPHPTFIANTGDCARHGGLPDSATGGFTVHSTLASHGKAVYDAGVGQVSFAFLRAGWGTMTFYPLPLL